MDGYVVGITQFDKKNAMKKLAIELPTLRARLKASQAELAELVGVSRQTYSMIENRKKEMGWSIYMALVLVFSSNPRTSSLLDFCDVFPKELQSVLKE